MSLTAAAKNLMLDALGTAGDFLSAHDGYPGTTGANEVSGGSPAYARKAMTWNAASGGNLDSLATPQFDIPAATEVQYYGIWDALTAGNFLGFMVVGGDPKEMVAAAVADTIQADGHGYADTNKVVFLDGTAPGGLTAGTVYFVRDATTNTFKVAATSGGAAIDLTDTGALACKVSLIVPEAFGSQGTLTASDADIALNL
jgi:hypothetical protein